MKLKNTLIKYKPVLRFLVTFLGTYLVFTVAYKVYLDQSDGTDFYPDYITNLVGKQSKALISTLGYDTAMTPHPNEPSMKLIIEGKFVARVVEGCNSVSIIILFVSFMLAFAGRFKPTFFYILAGSVLIYAVNIFRIAVLSIGLYHYPWRREVLHTVIFPLIIYGMVFLLWMVWVNRFSKVKRIK